MELLFFCTRWGSEHLKWQDFAQIVKDEGYDGIETSLPSDPWEQENMMASLSKHKLKLIGVHWDTVTANFNQHKAEMEERLMALIAVHPLFITSHTGKDHFSFKQNIELLTLAEQLSSSTGNSIFHETHRGKFSFAAHLTKAYLEELPWLRLTLDISHWFTVAESYLQDQQPAVLLALQQTAHIHSRVGFTEGPQVPDPGKPEWEEALQHHLVYWDKVIQLKKAAGETQFTFTSEFGPFPYMIVPGRGANAVKQQWELNNYMKNLLKLRY